MAYRRLIDDFDLTQDEVATVLVKAGLFIANSRSYCNYLFLSRTSAKLCWSRKELVSRRAEQINWPKSCREELMFGRQRSYLRCYKRRIGQKENHRPDVMARKINLPVISTKVKVKGGITVGRSRSSILARMN